MVPGTISLAARRGAFDDADPTAAVAHYGVVFEFEHQAEVAVAWIGGGKGCSLAAITVGFDCQSLAQLALEFGRGIAEAEL